MSLQDVALDIQRNAKRAAGAKALETRQELANNVYPLLLTLVEAVDERFREIEDVVAAIAAVDEPSAEVLTAVREAFTITDALVQFTAALPMTPEQKTQFEQLVAAYQAAGQKVADVLITDDDDDEEDDEDEDEEDDEGDTDE